MPRPRVNPPKNAVALIKKAASEGYEHIGIAEVFKVHVDLLLQWFEENPELEYAYAVGKEQERQALHMQVYNSAMNNASANSNARFLLKSRHGYIDDAKPSNNINVNVDARPVMVMVDHGDDETWAAKAAEQQRKLILNAASAPSQIEAQTDSAAPLILEEPSEDAPLMIEGPEENLPAFALERPEIVSEPLSVPAQSIAPNAPYEPSQIPSWQPPSWSPDLRQSSPFTPEWNPRA